MLLGFLLVRKSLIKSFVYLFGSLFFLNCISFIFFNLFSLSLCRAFLLTFLIFLSISCSVLFTLLYLPLLMMVVLVQGYFPFLATFLPCSFYSQTLPMASSPISGSGAPGVQRLPVCLPLPYSVEQYIV